MTNKFTALLLSIFLGGFGVDRFYLGYIGMGILKLLTGGVFGILYIIDIIMIATGSLQPADGSPYEDASPNTYGSTGYDNTGYNTYNTGYSDNGSANRSSTTWGSTGTNAGGRNQDVYDELERIGQLHDQGVLNDAEFNKLKADLLAKL